MTRSSRRDALKGGLGLAIASIGLAPAARAVTHKAPSGKSLASRSAFVLQATNVRPVGLEFGRRPDIGDRYTLVGDLREGVRGAALGEFFANVVALERAGAVAPGPTLAMHSHVLKFADGVLFGMGTVSTGEAADAFAIIGGSGQFAGVTGTYLATLRPLALGGDGSARFDVQLTGEGVR